MIMKIAVLLTTFNRKAKTLSCLESLENQELPAGWSVEVFLTDDASSDGTAAAVKTCYPDAHVFHGNGSLFWAGGMRHTWKQALHSDCDFYLLLNDDTLLFNTALTELVSCSLRAANTASPAMCIGSTVDSATGKLSYGGKKLSSKFLWSSYNIHSETDYLHCDFSNANILLVPKQVVAHLGILSSRYTHGLADYDYTLKAKKAGFNLVTAPGFLGSCTDDHGNNWKSQQASLKERIRFLKSPKGLAYKEYLGFIKYHFPVSYPSAFVKLWMKTFFPFIWDTLKK